MKILYWVPQFWPNIGGIERITAHSVLELKQRGYQIRVVTSFGELSLPAEDEFSGIPLYRFPFFRALNTRDLFLIKSVQRQLEKLALEFQPDWIHFHMGAPLAFFYLKSSILREIPLLLTVHQKLEGFSGGSDTVLGKLFREAKWTGAVSRSVLEDLREISPGIRNRSSVIYNGLPDMNQCLPQTRAEQPCLLCVGRLVEEKGFDTAIQAFSILAERFPGLNMVIVGDGPQREYLSTLAGTLNLTERILFSGWLDQARVYQEMRRAALVLIPSRVQEAFPMTAVESAMMGKPVIASRAGGLAEAVIDQQTGFLVEDSDLRGWVERITELLDHPHKSHSMGQKGRDLYREQFMITANIDAYEALYNSPGESQG